jgi:tetratricopeptide (TPR) repeat protein
VSALPKNLPRRIVPRWRTSDAAEATGELAPLPVREPIMHPEGDQEELARASSDFGRERTIGHAAELLSVAVALEVPDAARAAASFILEKREQAGEAASAVARRVVAGEEPFASPVTEPTTTETREVVQRTRRRIHEDARNVLAWLDLSRAYAAAGVADKAETAMRAALTLAPDHRFVLRSAARFFLHVGKPDEAHAYLRRSPASLHDPWLMAAEIAVATVAERSPKLVKAARSALASGHFTPFHIGEVASSLATLEVSAGSAKAARRLFRQALLDPTENSIAQAEWTARDVGLIEFDPSLLKREGTYEANTAAAYVGERWVDALAHARRWLADEPFSGRAAAIGSVIAGVALEEVDEAVRFARQGVRTDPSDLLLQNNLVFTLTETGCLDEAERVHLRIPHKSLTGTDRVIWLANTGLIAFRRGDLELGRKCYGMAVSVAREMKDARLERLAEIYRLGEEIRAGGGADRSAEIARVVSEAQTKPTPDVRIAVYRLERIRERSRSAVSTQTPTAGH